MFKTLVALLRELNNFESDEELEAETVEPVFTTGLTDVDEVFEEPAVLDEAAFDEFVFDEFVFEDFLLSVLLFETTEYW